MRKLITLLLIIGAIAYAFGSLAVTRVTAASQEAHYRSQCMTDTDCCTQFNDC